ncbi:MAG: rhomboid family intramembrane serine protease [Acidobacteria bacterium]|nr:rhomboid family intramembrane serine protease [Acidobacteriota bacterium]MCZ6769718.1 rhomboid family intramembrane serine protease [Acidobacteriota bacterium]
MIPFKDNVPSRLFPVITVVLILANVAAFLYEMSLPSAVLDDFFFSYGIVPYRLQVSGQSLIPLFAYMGSSLVTAMFLHGGFIHLLGNIWYLWIFGGSVEDRMGPFRFLLFYLLCGILAGGVQVLFNLNSRIPTIGASGAVAGVLGAYLISYPLARVSTLLPFLIVWPVVELPAMLLLGFWFFVQLLNGTASIGAASGMTGGVAWWAHIGGFLSGVILIWLFAREPARRDYLKG